MGIANDNDLLGEDPKPGPRPWAEWTPGTLVYGVDYDRDQAGNSTVPLDRFFKSIFWGIRDYLRYDSTATKEWNVFLNNKTFVGAYDEGAIRTGFIRGYADPADYHRRNRRSTEFLTRGQNDISSTGACGESVRRVREF